VRAREWENTKLNKRAKHSHAHFFVMFFHVCVFCYCFTCGVQWFFFLFRYFIDEVENWCKCFVLIVPINLLLVDYADKNVISRTPHIGGIFNNIRSYRMSYFYLKLSCKGSLFFTFSSFLTKYALLHDWHGWKNRDKLEIFDSGYYDFFDFW
jgi:hypothetical protein